MSCSVQSTVLNISITYIKIAAKYCDQDGRQIELKDLKGIRLNMAVASTPSTFLYTLLLIVMQAGELQQQEIS